MWPEIFEILKDYGLPIVVLLVVLGFIGHIILNSEITIRYNNKKNNVS